MTRLLHADICIIGAGSGGLAVAAGAAQLGARTVLVERAKMGGECLNSGCVPSKALLAAGRMAARAADGPAFGVEFGAVRIDAARVHAHVQGVIAAIAPFDSVERFESLGVTVIRASARFVGPAEIEAGDTRIKARRFVIATGSLPQVPPIAGLAEAPYLTNETIFDLDVAPAHLIVIGGGPLGVEMAEAHRRLGSRVTLLEVRSILARDDAELVGVIRSRLTAAGVSVREGVEIGAVDAGKAGLAVTWTENGTESRVEGSHLLVATGRRPAVDGLELSAAGITLSEQGIAVDARLRTHNRRVFAIGDVIGGNRFTHVAGYQAGIVIRNALFRIPSRADSRCIPRVTYTDPELAQVGITEAEAAAARLAFRVLRWSYRDNDRAQAEHVTDGLVKVIVGPRGHILGAGIVGAAAGELIQVWVLAISRRLTIGSIATMIVPYPTLGEISKRAAGTFFTPALFGKRSRWLVRFLGRFG
jgi:pyruvate/2-oxoglutarate dehydrogenase complex dihydrolipoamide dehydrogenase (E3) component